MRGIDLRILAPALLLAAIGVLAVFSGQQGLPDGPGYGQRQILWFVGGMVMCAVLALVPMRIHEGLAFIYYACMVVALVAVLGAGRGDGATRWFAVGPLHVQPSEVGKIVLVFVLGRALAYRRERPQRPVDLLAPSILAFIPFVLVLRQPDLGTAMVFIAVLVVVLYWAGVPAYVFLLVATPLFSMVAAFHWLAWLAFMVLCAGFIVASRQRFAHALGLMLVNVAVGVATPIVWHGLHDYQRLRILSFLNPGLDPKGAGYQVMQSKIAIGSGGLLGKGYLAGTQTKLQFLPEQHTDFVFSVIGEEFGFVGTVAVVLLFAWLLSRGISAASRARDKFSSIAAIGAVSIIGFQFIVNVGMTLGLLPVAGVPLPFVSYGGSSMLMSFACVGLMLNAGGARRE